MNIKNIIRTAVTAVACTMTMMSCDSYLDTMPDNRATIDTESKIAALLVSAYPTTNFAFITEMSSDNIDLEAAPTYTTYTKLEDEAANWQDITYKSTESPYSLWNACYMAAGSANHALEAIKEAGEPESLNGMKAEALLCRAYAHWVLANVFCKAYSPKTCDTDLGITYMDKPETELNPQYERGTLAETYKAIEGDIQAALPIIDESHIKVLKYHFNRKAAYAFAARFYLQYTQPDKSNYRKVIEYADVALNGNAGAAIRDWQTLGAKDINNSVRAMAYTDASDNANLLIISTYSLWPYICGPYSMAYKYCHDNTIADNETCAPNPWGSKSTLYFRIPQYSGMPKVIMAKTAMYFETTDAINNTGYPHAMFPIFTTDEVVINRAEAYTMLGEYDLAADDLNAWGTRFYQNASSRTADQIAAFYEALDYYTPTKPTPKKALNPDYVIEEGKQENMIHAVLAARRILTLHDGLRWFDIKRFGIEIYRRSILSNKVEDIVGTLKKDDPRRAIQLPQSVITAGVTPNPRNN